MITRQLPKGFQSWSEYNLYLEIFFQKLKEKINKFPQETSLKQETTSPPPKHKHRPVHLGIYIDDE